MKKFINSIRSKINSVAVRTKTAVDNEVSDTRYAVRAAETHGLFHSVCAHG